MSAKPLRLGAVVAILAFIHIQVSSSQFFQQPIRYGPRTGSVSRANSNAFEREVNYGPLEISRGVANSRTVTRANGGFRNGGLTSVSNSNALSRGIEVGGLDIGSTLTRSQTRNNGAVSNAVSHDLNVGNLNIGSSLSRDNLRNGFGLQRASDGGLQLGLGLLNLDLSRNNPQSSGALTQAQAQAQGLNARARANSNARTHNQQYGLVGVSNTFSKSNAVSRTKQGQTSAFTGGAAANGLNYGRGFRVRRASSSPTHIRPKRRAQFIPFAYPGGDLDRPKRQFGRGRRPQSQNANAQGLANNKNNLSAQQAGANTQTNQEINESGITQNNAASSIGSNLATDGTTGQVSSANVAQMNAVTNDGSQGSNNAQSQALNFEGNQQQAVSSNAGTSDVTTATGQQVGSNSGALATNNNQFGSSSNVANTNAGAFREGDTEGSNADSSSQSIYQGNNGENSSANTGSNVSSMLGPDGSVSNSATSNASADSQGGSSANANANASASSNASAGGGGGFANAQGNAGGGGALANSGAFGNHRGSQGFANSQFGNRRAMKTGQLITPSKLQIGRTLLGNGLSEAPTMAKTSKHQQHKQPYPAAGSDNSSVEIFGAIDENERTGRTFSVIGDLIDSLTPRCVKPCTMEAYIRNICCETVVLVPPPQPNVCCQQPSYPMPSYPIAPYPYPPYTPQPGSTTVSDRPVVIVPSPTRPVMVLGTNPLAYPMTPSQCCTTCTANGYYGPPPCVRYQMPRVGPGRIMLYAPPLG